MRCVVVEDTAIGATAGKAANMKVGPFFQTLGVSKGCLVSVRILKEVSKVHHFWDLPIGKKGLYAIFGGFLV